jgi:hypothetical protein
MTACNGCGRDNAAPRRYCGGCGGKLFWDCTTCAFVNRSDDRFCGGCGHAGAGAGAADREPARPTPLAAVPRPRTEPAVTAKGRHAATEVSLVELASLMAPPEQPAAPAQPAGRITQDDLDNLFKAGG